MKQISSMIHWRSDPGAIIVGDVLYVFGGGSLFKPKNSCEKYDMKTDLWEKISPMNMEWFGPSVCLVN